MKTLSQSMNKTDTYHQRCVCQICTCHKHHCPHSHLNLPLGQISTTHHDYIPHQLNPWQKPPPQKAKPYQPYGNINSSYKSDYPGHKPQLRQKIVPRVKNQDKNLPFTGSSQYKNSYPGKSVIRDPIRNKDRQYNPDNTPFEGISTYKTSYDPKQINPHKKKQPIQAQFPPGYGFYGESTYKKDFDGKYVEPPKNCKPPEKISGKGSHDLNTIHRQDYGPKKMPQPCPILNMPQYPKIIYHPKQHLFYNKHHRNWDEK